MVAWLWAACDPLVFQTFSEKNAIHCIPTILKQCASE